MTSLPDPKMQEALSEIRLIRVDVEVFREDLEKLHFRDGDPRGLLLAHPGRSAERWHQRRGMGRRYPAEHRARDEAVRARRVQDAKAPVPEEATGRNVPLTAAPPEPLVCPRCRARAPAASGLQAAGRCPKDGAFFVSERALARSDGDPLLGCTLGGRFAVLALRARGARASVYDSRVVPAAPEGAGRPTTAPIASAVLKVVRCDGPRSEAALALAWEGEVQRLASAAVAPGWLGQGCSEVGDEPRFAAFVASERAPGASLAEPSEQSFLERATRAARALAALHAAGIVHGDLTPEHVFVDAQRSAATFVDFGSAALDAGGGWRTSEAQRGHTGLCRARALGDGADPRRGRLCARLCPGPDGHRQAAVLGGLPRGAPRRAPQRGSSPAAGRGRRGRLAPRSLRP
jgi:hypothetical protein